MQRRIGLLVTDGVQLLDLSGPADVFAEACRVAGRPLYTVHTIAAGSGPLRSSSGVRLLPDAAIGSCPPTGFDTVLVAGAPDLDHRAAGPALLDWLRAASASARRTASVCTGAFLLAEAGLLENRRATTHWACAERFRQRFPAVELMPDAIHVADGPFRTAAGVTAGLDLALALVEEDETVALAREVAAQLVMFFRRGGGQLQHARAGRGAVANRSVLQEVQRWVAAHPAADHGVDALAARAGLSSRHFARLFVTEIGVTPAAWVEELRIDAARRLLEQGVAPKAAGGACGFGDPETFRRAFRRRTGASRPPIAARNGRDERLARGFVKARDVVPDVIPEPRAPDPNFFNDRVPRAQPLAGSGGSAPGFCRDQVTRPGRSRAPGTGRSSPDALTGPAVLRT